MPRWTCHVCTPPRTRTAETFSSAERAGRTHYLNAHYYPRSDVTPADRLAYFRSPRHVRV